MLNRVVLVGRLTRDPELRYTPQNIAVASFTIAVNRSFSNSQTGEREADFIPVVVWRKQAENVKAYTHSGSLVGVEGRIQTRTYDDQSGVRHYVTEIVADNVVFLEPKGDNTNPQSNNVHSVEQKESPKEEDDQYADVTFSSASDDLPF